MPNKEQEVTNKQVEDNRTITFAQVKEFITDAKKKQEEFRQIANESWNEIEKRNKRGRLYSNTNNIRRRNAKFPLWWSCWKIRQPITLARLAVPILKDTQGDDPIGRTACIVGERLTRGILKTFDAFPEFSAANDDFLITNFGWGRAFYRMTESVEDEKLRVLMLMPEQTEPQIGTDGKPVPMPPPTPIFIDPNSGEEIVDKEILEDEEGPYVMTGQQIEVQNEEVYFQAGLYSNLLVDPDATRWSKVNRLAFENEYSYRDFIEKFGKDALAKLEQGDIDEHKTGKPIIVYEYWDKFLRECYYLAENSCDFFQPQGMTEVDINSLKEVKEEKEDEGYEDSSEYDNSDLYGLTGFFPCAEPLVFNASTRSFWPTPEYYQVQDILDDINGIVKRMILLTKAIRVRFLYDSSVPELTSLISERQEADATGISNLQAVLMAGKGDLRNLVAYFPTEELIKGLTNMYTSFEQRLNMFYQITGISDLIRGQTSDVEKTYGERQLEGKFALNRIEPFQRLIQQWMKNNYQLLMEMALKMFSDETLDDYITPHTLDPEDKQRYPEALNLLRTNKRSRFRIDFETDSTIAINQEWKRSQAVDLANTLTKAMESTAKVAETQPELAETELKVLKHLIGEFSEGKLFIDEIQDSIEKVIEKVAQPRQEAPDPAVLRVQLETEKLKFEQARQGNLDRMKEIEIQAKEVIEIEKIKRDERIATIEAQIEQFKISSKAQSEGMQLAAESQKLEAEIAAKYQEISSSIMLAREEMELKRQELMVEVRKIVDKKEMDQFEALLSARTLAFDEQLATAQHELEKSMSQISQLEKVVTEVRLQDEHNTNLHSAKLEGIQKLLDTAIKQQELINLKKQPEEKEVDD